MNISKLKLYTGFICLTLLLPSFSEAYFTTSQSAIKLNDSTVLFTVSYGFGLKDRDLLMPIYTERTEFSKSEDTLSYSILNQGTTTAYGKTVGVVLTKDEDVKVVDGQYFLPAGQSAEFTLISLLTLDEELSDTDLSLLVTHLPFTMVVDEVSHQNQLNPSELQYYLTPSISTK